jgi:poly-gamma-glutamate capsule biosynthesis protein CapA/YwtB (metallophosphatase superfamily)
VKRALEGLARWSAAVLALCALHWSFAYLLVSPAHFAPGQPAAATIARTPSRPGHASVLVLGDTGPGDAAEETLVRSGYDYPYRATVDLVRGADLAIANLEMPITDRGSPPTLYKDYIYRARPEAAPALAWAGLDIVSLANNHVIDYGDVGLADSIDAVRRAGMISLGAGNDEASARRGVIATIGEVRVGVLAFCQRQPLWEMWVDQFARAGRPGTVALTDEALRADIARLRPSVDVLVVMLHIGYNYRAPADTTIAWSRRAIELGADLVVDHHPHVSHPLMLHEGRPIALSVGNYAFGTPGHDALEEGLMVFAEIEGRRLDRLEIVPIDVQNRRVSYQPRPLTGEALDRSLGRLIEGSAQRGAKLERVGDRAVLRLGGRS